jgi:cytochrome c oxidase cbb3-type subunit 3
MRVLIFAILISMLAFGSGCNTAPPAIADSGPSAAAAPVGPIPGEIAAARYAANPLANDAVALQDGRRLFDWYNCSGCHGGHAGGGMGPSLRDKVWLYGNRDDQIYDSIAQGRSKGMPAWGSKIPQTQIWELVAYIKSMRTPQEPDPPVEPVNEMVPDPENVTAPGIGMQTASSEIQVPK